uniref:Host-nuclease inhibitor protein n=1 Tax=viral metagenome TaxID=1070528 RepID=A0A6M3XI67_9ZZZZ
MDDWGIDELINKGGVMIMNNGEIYKESIGKLLKETDDIVFKIRVLKDDNEKMNLENDKKIIELQGKLMETEATLKDTLTKSKEEAIKTKMGWAHFRIMKDKIVYTDKTIEEIETKYPSEADNYIKISKSLKLDPLKKDIEAGNIVLNEMSRVPQEKKFEYKYTG